MVKTSAQFRTVHMKSYFSASR